MTDELSPPSSPPLLPQGEKGASRSAQGERHFDRLRWRCRRGLLELDLTLLSFLELGYRDLDPVEQMAFDRLLAAPDNTLLAYLQGSENPSDKEIRQLVAKIRK